MRFILVVAASLLAVHAATESAVFPSSAGTLVVDTVAGGFMVGRYNDGCRRG
jgi:hypothetical protein